MDVNGWFFCLLRALRATRRLGQGRSSCRRHQRPLLQRSQSCATLVCVTGDADKTLNNLWLRKAQPVIGLKTVAHAKSPRQLPLPSFLQNESLKKPPADAQGCRFSHRRPTEDLTDRQLKTEWTGAIFTY